MKRKYLKGRPGLSLLLAAACWGFAVQPAGAAVTPADVRANGQPDYNTNANWAYSPPMQKFINTLPGLCGAPTGTDVDGVNDLGQCIPVAVPDKDAYPGSDYYEFEVVQFREQMHGNLLPVVGGKMDLNATGGTLLRGYRQTNAVGPGAVYAEVPHNLGPIIVAERDTPVRIKFTNSMPTGDAGDLFIPVDTTVMGSGPGPLYDRTVNPEETDAEACNLYPETCFSQNRHVLHLHGGRTPWISDGTAHQWVTPAGEFAPGDPRDPYYAKGTSVAYVPDMWFDETTGATIASCAGQTSCGVAGATNNPGDGSQTYYWTNAQSARLMFYHDHSWGTTRLGVYVGGVAGYLIEDQTERDLAALIPDADHTIPLIIQDKTFVDPATILTTDPTWIWGSKPGTLYPWDPTQSSTGDPAEPVLGDLWWPHVYVPAQDPYNSDLSGINPYGRWAYGPWFWPPTVVPYGPVTNDYYDPTNNPEQPPEIPGTPNPSWGAEAFLDTPVINGTAYPQLTVDPEKYRFRILNGAHDRFWNLQFYVADTTDPKDVTMVQAVTTAGFPGDPLGPEPNAFPWPADDREGGVPDPAKRGPAMIQIGTDGGFLPAPVLLPNHPVNWNVDVTTFAAGVVLQQNQGGGTLMLGPAERADVIVDFSAFAGKTLILYNDAPAPWPAGDFHYDYYTNNPDYTPDGGAPSTLPGMGPNTRTIMQILVGESVGDPTPGGDTTPGPVNAHDTANLAALQTAFAHDGFGAGLGGVFEKGQEPIIVAQGFPEYESAYGKDFPNTWPNWGISRIFDTEISFATPEGAIVSMYPMEPKAIQDEQGEVFDEFGRMSARLGLELAKTTAGIQTFITQNFVDPPTEIVAQDQIQIWKITHNGVDTHPVHFHLFEVQLINRVGWDGFIYTPDPNEMGWKDTIRISPLMDTIVALRPVKVPVPFNVPNSVRPLNPAYEIGKPARFTNIDPFTGERLTTEILNQEFNFGHEYLWHCHILSHEEQDMMRVIVLNASSLVYTLNAGNGFWEWNRGDWTQIATNDPVRVVSHGSFAYADYGVAGGLWEWNGYDWKQITTQSPTNMVASESGLYATFPGGLYKWNRNSWTRLTALAATDLAASGSSLYAYFTGYGLYEWNGILWNRITTLQPLLGSMTASDNGLYVTFNSYGFYEWSGGVWTRLTSLQPSVVAASGTSLYAQFPSYGLYQWNGTAWSRLTTLPLISMEASGSDLYASFTGYGLYRWNGGTWTRIYANSPSDMVASGTVLYANFTGAGGGYDGLYKWEMVNSGGAGAWTPLLNTTPVASLSPGF